MIGGALALYAWRAPLLKSNAGFDLLSRESFLLFNNILLVVAAATVLGGTLAPLIADTFGQTSLSVGAAVLPPDLPAGDDAAAAAAVGGHSCQLEARPPGGSRPAVAGDAGGGRGAGRGRGVRLLSAGRHALAIIGIGIGGWIILSSLLDPVDRLRRHLSLSRAVLGMTLAHIGLGVAVIALDRCRVLYQRA